MKKINISQNQLTSISFYLGLIFTGVPFLSQLFLSTTPDQGTHIFTYYANELILNKNLSLFSSLFSFLGSAMIAYGVFSLNQLLQTKVKNPLMNFSVFLFVFSSLGFIISRSQDLIIIWGSASESSKHMMFEFALIFSFGIFYWIGIGLFAFCLYVDKFLNKNFLMALSILSVVNVFLIVFTIFNVDPYDISTVKPLYTGFTIGNTLLLIFCFMSGKKLV